jgi:tagaturonate reductase
MEKSVTPLNRSTTKASKTCPTKIIQFGEGNFLRAFVDWMVHQINQNSDFNAGVTIIQPIEKGLSEIINKQEGLYHVILQGIKSGQFQSDITLVDCVNQCIDPYSDYEVFLKEAENPELRFIISNTTEAGITFSDEDKKGTTPAKTFPGKLVQFLHHRYQVLPESAPIVVLPCELIEGNGIKLKEAVLNYVELWNLGSYFENWLHEKFTFCNTLVDRIVPGFPHEQKEKLWEQLGYEDQLMVEAELFHLWVIEGPEQVRSILPAKEAKLNVIFTYDLDYYRTRKVRILNGLHTLMVPVGLLKGLTTVRQCIEDKQVSIFLKNALHHEILPTLPGENKELEDYAEEIMNRFRNPALKHELQTIALNSSSKFKTRVLPSLLEYVRIKNDIPENLTTGLAALIQLYKGDHIKLHDDTYVLDKMQGLWNDSENDYAKIVNEVLSDAKLWETNLLTVPGLRERVLEQLRSLPG